MENKSDGNLDAGILKTDLELSLIFGLLAVISVMMDVGAESIFDPGLLLTFALGTIWAAMVLVFLDKSILKLLRRRNQKFAHIFKMMIVTSAVVYCCVDIVTLYLTKTHLKMYYIELMLLDNFRERSRITDSTYYGGIFLLLFFVFSSSISFHYHSKVRFRRYRLPRHFYMVFFVFIITERVSTAYGDYLNYPSVRAINESVFWRPRSASSLFGEVIEYKLQAGILPNPTALQIVKKPPPENLPNIVLVLAESLRGDVVTPEVMPYISQAEGTVFQNHYSASNSTHLSLFSALFGMFPIYYGDAVEKSPTPVLFNFVKELGYTKHLFSSCDFNWWKMDSFMKKEDFDSFTIIDDKAKDMPIKDMELVENFKKTFTEKGKPQFHFVLFNSTHHNYYYPDTPEFERFTPTISKDANLFTINFREDADKVRNRYKNSAFFLDSILADMAEHIKAEGEWDNTIFIVFGDHGEEFFEDGRIAHANYLNHYQTSTMLYFHRPEDESKKIASGFATSHIDILPTILNLFDSYGVEYEKVDWMKGSDIFGGDLAPDRKVFSASTNKIVSSHFATHERSTVCYMAYDVLNPECQRIIEEGLEEFYSLAGDN